MQEPSAIVDLLPVESTAEINVHLRSSELLVNNVGVKFRIVHSKIQDAVGGAWGRSNHPVWFVSVNKLFRESSMHDGKVQVGTVRCGSRQVHDP